VRSEEKALLGRLFFNLIIFIFLNILSGDKVMTEYRQFEIDKFTFRVATDRFYDEQGLWVSSNERNIIRIGLSDYIQQRSGDVAFVDVKPAGNTLNVKDEVFTIETIKVSISFHCPEKGILMRSNPAMETTPELINQDPYGEGWIAEIAIDDWDTTRLHLLDADTYYEQIKQEAEKEAKNL
jgi:glycine cleavage system H protein